NGTDYRRTGRALQGGKYVISAKTGTAETPIPNPNNPNEMINLVNSSMVAYAPQENPELAVSVIIPHIQDESDALHAVMTKEIFNAYYDYKH
ncbi:MAG TPA: penicillin-binding transpeptidase domain-containing protein, partial [Erysipelothrix sp.]